MSRLSLIQVALPAVIAMVLLWPAGRSAAQDSQPTADDAPGPTHAVAVMHATEGHSVSGTIEFTRQGEGVRVVVTLSGLEPGTHGFHIHQYGDCSAPDGTSAGGHFNPMAVDHGAPDGEVRHVGDLGNITADDSGQAALDVADFHALLTGEHAIIGHAVIIHAGADDLTTQPTGAAGPRVACGVIGVAAEE
jgi:Cu-Zn family superoxide dismutase